MALELKEEGYRLKDVLLVVGIPEATYYYHLKRLDRTNQNLLLKDETSELFYQFKERFGYKRITRKLNNVGLIINYKKVYRLMEELGVRCVKFTRRLANIILIKGQLMKSQKTY